MLVGYYRLHQDSRQIYIGPVSLPAIELTIPARSSKPAPLVRAFPLQAGTTTLLNGGREPPQMLTRPFDVQPDSCKRVNLVETNSTACSRSSSCPKGNHPRWCFQQTRTDENQKALRSWLGHYSSAE
jgi:hypothetical protein